MRAVCEEGERVIRGLRGGLACEAAERGPVAGVVAIPEKAAGRVPLSAFAGWLHLPPSARLPFRELGTGSLVMLPPDEQGPEAGLSEGPMRLDSFAATLGALSYEGSFGAALKGIDQEAPSPEVGDGAERVKGRGRVIRFDYSGADGASGLAAATTAAAEDVWRVPGIEAGGEGAESDEQAWSDLRTTFFGLVAPYRAGDVAPPPALILALPPALQAGTLDGCYYPLLPVYLAVLVLVYSAGMGTVAGARTGADSSMRMSPSALCDAVRGIDWVGLLPQESVGHIVSLHRALTDQ